ncbi:MAG: TlpA family protein disulfide reductase [Candidatus Omnitrophica bacterium]|nr:TlpA family protein disulfide reductase [Candidatus Omnitrophota bacterium]MCF7894041.1 TlpA family protein disulfide reductase [Candidatus Omnitrophota bacterium]
MIKRSFWLLIVLFFLTTASAETGRLVDLGGKLVSYQKITSSPKTILFVWTSWCPYCQIQLAKISKRCSYPDIKLLLVNSGEKKSSVERFVENKKVPKCVTKNIILDKNSTIAKKFSLSGFPTFIFLKDGKYLARSYYLNNDLIDKIY